MDDSLEESTQLVVGMTLDSINNRLLLTDARSSRLLGLDLETKQRTVISSPGVPNNVNAMDGNGNPVAAILDVSGDYLFLTNSGIGVLAVDNETGYRVIIAR